MKKAGVHREIPWIYDSGEIVEMIPDEYLGSYNLCFVYKLEFKDGDYYIGKHTCFHKQTQRRLVSGKERPHHVCWSKDRTKERFFKEDWQDYIGSGKDYDVKDIKKRYILAWCDNKYSASFLEAKLIMNCFFEKKCLNGNVLGGFYKDAHKLSENMIHYCE